MTEWRRVDDTNVEVSDDGRVRRDGVEFVPHRRRGYKCVYIGGRTVDLHRLIAAIFVPNPFGKPCVDHINGNLLNNAVSNLRWATLQENARNRKPRIKESDLPRGISVCKGKFQARIKYEEKDYCLGTYDTPEEASEVYEVTAEELFGEFYRKP